MNAVNVDVIQQFRGNNGVITSGMFKGARLLLLTTRGRRVVRRESIRWHIPATATATW